MYSSKEKRVLELAKADKKEEIKRYFDLSLVSTSELKRELRRRKKG